MSTEGGLSNGGVVLTSIIFVLGVFAVASETSWYVELFFLVITAWALIRVYLDYRWLG